MSISAPASTTAVPISLLRQRMQHDMMMRGLGPHTQRDYSRHVRRLAAFLGRPPDTATEEDLRRFQIHQHEAGASVPTINGAVSALRFLYTVTLRRRDLARSLVATKRPYKVPEVLSVEEAARLLEAAPGIKYKAALGVAYGAGLRVSEVAHLKVDDIDSTRMLIRVEQGKGGRDRNAMLSPLLLELLRLWWREGKRRGVMFPHGWLFPGGSYTDPLSTRQLHGAVREAAEVAGICGRRLGCREFRPYAAWRHGLRSVRPTYWIFCYSAGTHAATLSSKTWPRRKLSLFKAGPTNNSSATPMPP